MATKAEYNENNIFNKILKGEIPCEKVFENDYVLAFNDINPKAPVHILVITKEKYVSWHDFAIYASDDEKREVFNAVKDIAEMKGLDKTGYRVQANTGEGAGQEVPHFHLHIMGG